MVDRSFNRHAKLIVLLLSHGELTKTQKGCKLRILGI